MVYNAPAKFEKGAGSDAEHRIAFILVPDFSMIAFSSAVETLRLANRASAQPFYGWRCYSPDGQSVKASNGIVVEVDGGIADLDRAPMVMVCGGVEVQRFADRPLLDKLRRLAAHGATLGGICTAPFLLAKAGLLDSHRCTIHWENLSAFQEEFPHIEITSELYEIDRKRVTCAGGTAALDMMLTIIAEQCGYGVSTLVADMVLHHRIRDGHEKQRMDLRVRLGISNPKLLSVIEIMEDNLETPLSCAELAVDVGLSTRQLERLFHKYLKRPPTRYYLGLRLERARFLLSQTSMPVLTVALACGFVSASHFSKCYREHFERTPSEERMARV
jgi:AraC family transcriptional regulator, glycine betaine-responsive activator